MKILLPFLFLFSALLYGQAASQPNAPVKVTPGTPAVNSPSTPAVSSGPGTPPAVPPDTVVAEVNGRKYTAAEMDKLIGMLPPQYQQVAHAQPQMLNQLFLMQRLAEDAEKAGLDQKAPYKDQLAMQRMQMLSTAELSTINNSMVITQDDQSKYYRDNPDKFKEVKVRAIYVAFGTTSVKTLPGTDKPAPESEPKPAADAKKLTDVEAQAKIEDLAKQIKAGADFGTLARENSDDKTSAAKDGDFGVIRQDSAYPQAIKTAIFALKPGELSAPIKQPNGFYLLRAESVDIVPFNSAIAQIVQAVKQEKFQEWMKGMQAQYSVKVENHDYFAPRVPPQLPPAH